MHSLFHVKCCCSMQKLSGEIHTIFEVYSLPEESEEEFGTFWLGTFMVLFCTTRSLVDHENKLTFQILGGLCIDMYCVSVLSLHTESTDCTIQ